MVQIAWRVDVGTLQPAEIDLIAVMFRRPPMCPARRHALQIMVGPTPEQVLEIQLYLRQISQPCKEVWALKRLYEDYRILCGESDRRQRDPTTQEQDHKNSTHKKGKYLWDF